MSGKPYPEAVRRVVELLQQSAKVVREERAKVYEELTKLVRDMEMLRHVQGVANLSPHDKTVLEGAFKEIERLKKQVARCERHGLGAPKELKDVEFCSKSGALIVGELVRHYQEELAAHVAAVKKLQETADAALTGRDEMKAALEVSNRDRDEAQLKLSGLADQFTKLEAKNQQQAKALAMVKTDRDGVYVWEGNRAVDDPETLSCPIVMSADRLLELLGAADKLKAAAIDLEETISQRRAIDLPAAAIALMKIALGRPP